MNFFVDESTFVSAVFIDEYRKLEANTNKTFNDTHPSHFFAFICSRK